MLTIILLFTQNTLADTLTVKQDSTGNYIIIQNAINEASDGDIVLVWPGTYYENVDFAGKNIMLASLALTTGDNSYRHSTIIDGNQSGSCATIVSDETDAYLLGFTLQNGSGYAQYSDWVVGGGLAIIEATATINNCIIKGNSVKHLGGGISINYANVEIYNCIIQDNFTELSSGGIGCMGGSLFLSGSTIRYNHALHSGGGIGLGEFDLTFDPDNLCNIYLNYADRGCDIVKGVTEMLHVLLDTCTVLNPDNYYLIAVDWDGYPTDSIDYNILNQKINPVDADLYVNPLSGDNSNSGLTATEPLQSIAFAYSKIIVDSTMNNTIHLADGIYSDTANNEKFPLNIRPFINVTGQSTEGTILDGRFKSMLISGNTAVSNYSFSTMTMTRGGQIDYDDFVLNSNGFGHLYWDNDNKTLENILFYDGIGNIARSGLVVAKAKNSRISNCTFSNYKGSAALGIGLSTIHDTCRISNCIIIGTKPDTNNPDYSSGRGIAVSGAYGAIITNTLFDNNDRNSFLNSETECYAVNCTFVNNSLLQPPSVSVWVNGGDLYMYNCISYNNGTKPFYINSLDETEGNFHVRNSLIEGGIESITLLGDAFLHYDEATNINTDPFFLNKWEHPYQIADGSPCIDAGTLNLPDFIELPEFDLAGNPRIVGDSIDMGAYEWNPTVGIDKYQYQPIKNEKPKLLHAAPNPFSASTIISAQWDFSGHVQIEIYNNSGLRVKVLKSGTSGRGSIQAQWDGKDQNGNMLPAGIYHVVMFWDGKEVEGMKVVKQ